MTYFGTQHEEYPRHSQLNTYQLSSYLEGHQTVSLLSLTSVAVQEGIPGCLVAEEEGLQVWGLFVLQIGPVRGTVWHRLFLKIKMKNKWVNSTWLVIHCLLTVIPDLIKTATVFLHFTKYLNNHLFYIKRLSEWIFSKYFHWYFGHLLKMIQKLRWASMSPPSPPLTLSKIKV